MFESMPGPVLGHDLAAAAPQELGDDELREALVAWDRMIGWAQAGQLAVMSEIGRRIDQQVSGMTMKERAHYVDPQGFAPDEVAVELRISRVAANSRYSLARALDDRPATAAALSAGRLDQSKTRVIAENLPALGAEVADRIEPLAIDYAQSHTPGQLRAWLERRIVAADPTAAEERRVAARRDRRVVHEAHPNGLGSLWALLSAEDAAAAYRIVDDIARESAADTDPRSADERRADAFVDLLLGRAGARAGHTQVIVTMSAASLAGVSGAPAELVGHGPITAEHARRLAGGDVRWRRLLTDPIDGTAVDLGASTYRPSSRLARLVQVRDGTCRFPGCRRAAARCDIDHTEAFPSGATVADNLACLCRHHHLLKHHGGWQVEHLDGARLRWTSPVGHVFVTEPATYDHDLAPPGEQSARSLIASA
jgi:hypothetical protein